MNKKIILFISFIILNFLKVIFFYFKISKITPAFILYEFFLIFLIYSIFFNIKSKIVLWFFYILQLLYLSINFTYYSYFKIYLSINTFILLFWQGILSFLKGAFPFYPEWIFFLIDLPLFLILLKGENFKKVLRENKKILFFAFSLSFVFLFFYAFFNFKEIKEKERIYDFAADFRTLERFGLPFYQIENFLKKADRPENLKKSEIFIEGEGKGKKYNLIFIQVESLDSSIIMENYKEKPVMPYLYRIKDLSVFYPYVISYHYGGGTSDCEFSIFNSLEPLFDFPSIKLLNYEYRNSFLKILRNEGYKIKAFHGNDGNFWNRSYAFPAMGFEEFYDIKKMGLKMKGWGAPDEEVFSFMLDKLKLEKKPFFYFVITMSSHMPFTNVKNYFNDKRFEGLENRVLRNYFSSMYYVDGILEKYVEELLKIPDTYIFIYGDHVGVYKENGFEGCFLEMEGLKIEFVPLIILTPEGKIYREEKFVASFLDFAPTALSSSGVPFKYFTEGQNLLDFPIKNTKISPFFKKFERQELFQKIKSK